MSNTHDCSIPLPIIRPPSPERILRYLPLEFHFPSRRPHPSCGREWSSDVFFFCASRRRHTRCGREWSSDVCSSDLTPMPSFADLIDQKFLTDEELWRLAQYVRSLSPAAPPEVRDVVHAPQIPGTVPVSPDDSAWARVTRYWFPLVGQVIHQSRWFALAVSGVWVQALHDGKTLALRGSWDDRTESPDTAWLKFEQRILETVAGDDSAGSRAKAEPWPDQLAVQFPRHLPQGMERPYFL